MRYITFRFGVSACKYSFNSTSNSDAVITALCGKRTRYITSLCASLLPPFLPTYLFLSGQLR